MLNWLDMLCFLLQGLPVEGTMNAVIAYMYFGNTYFFFYSSFFILRMIRLADWYRPKVTLDYPKGGSGAIIDALVRGLTKNGKGKLVLNSHVEEVLVEKGKAIGVKVRNTRTKEISEVKASKAVVSNIDVYHTSKLFSSSSSLGEEKEEENELKELTSSLQKQMKSTAKLASFIHLHAGIDATGLPSSPTKDFPTQWAVVKDWNMEKGVEAPRNVVLVSMPSLIDPSLAPAGKHVIHGTALVPYASLIK